MKRVILVITSAVVAAAMVVAFAGCDKQAEEQPSAGVEASVQA